MKKTHTGTTLLVLFWTTLLLPMNSVLGSDVEIVGSSEFTNQIVKALTLLNDKAPAAFMIVTHNVKRIEQGKHSGMWAYKTPPTYEMGDTTTFYSVTWCAATIAHDSFHSKLYHDYTLTIGGPVPDSTWTGTHAEKQCMNHQLAVMALIGASTNEIDHARQQNDGHYVNDKESWDTYYKRRTW